MKNLPVTDRQMFLASAILLALAVALGLYTFRSILFVSKKTVEETKVDQPETVPQPMIRNSLWGFPCQPTEAGYGCADHAQVTAVVIENSVDARPQLGLDHAFLVIEAPAEANIPRFIGFFNWEFEEATNMGPVRSARPYFLDWAEEFDYPVFAHVGGSPEALASLPSRAVYHQNEFLQGAIRRDATRPAPHNAYTSVYELYDAMTAKNEDWLSRDISYGVWSFDEKPPEGAVSASSLTVDFSASVNQVIWRYDETAGGWIRAQGGKDAITADGKTISASNVAVVITDISILDAVGRRKIRTIGEGEGYVLRDGMKIDATWKKPSTKERLRFYDQAGKEIPMKPGATWIEVVGGEGQVTIK